MSNIVVSHLFTEFSSLPTELKEHIAKRMEEFEENPNYVLRSASALKWMKERADKFPDPIQIFYNDTLMFLQHNITPTNVEGLRKYFVAKKQKGEEIGEWNVNHYRVIRVLNEREFDRVVLDNTTFHERFVVKNMNEYIKSIDGFVKEESFTTNDYEGDVEYRNVPFVYLRESLTKDIKKMSQVREHEDSHAFSKMIQSPEEVYGYNLDYGDDGLGDIMVRQKVDEWIAGLEGGNDFCIHHGPKTAYIGGEKGYERLERLTEENWNAVDEARKKVERKDLGKIMRVIPVQIMGRVLPVVAEEYKTRGGLPEYNPIDR
jgi:hypothetical protein